MPRARGRRCDVFLDCVPREAGGVPESPDGDRRARERRCGGRSSRFAVMAVRRRRVCDG